MKSFMGAIGMLTIAQWLFVGLLYVFLQVQNKTTPETMTKLHDFPVIGGYFPKVKVPTEKEKERTYGDELRERIVDARRQWNLPPSYKDEEFIALMTEIKTRGEKLKEESRKLEKRKLQIRSMEEEMNRREKVVIARFEKLAQAEQKLALVRNEVNLSKKGQDLRLARQEKEHNKKIARWLNSMSPEAAAERLTAAPENETPEEAQARYRQAARLLALLDDEQAAKVLESISKVDWVKIEEAKRSLPVGK